MDDIETQHLNVENFNISRDDLIDIVAALQSNRSFDEEIQKLETLGGIDQILLNLRTSQTMGINGSITDIQSREKAFGNNLKPEVKTQGQQII